MRMLMRVSERCGCPAVHHCMRLGLHISSQKAEAVKAGNPRWGCSGFRLLSYSRVSAPFMDVIAHRQLRDGAK